MSQSTKSPEEYMKEPYARVLIPDPETGTCTARILEFPGCITQGGSAEEALRRLEDSAESWVQACLDTGKSVPQPAAAQEYSGKVALRLPRSLHQQAVEMAEREGVSLNQLLATAVAARLGARGAADELYDRIYSNLRRDWMATTNRTTVNVTATVNSGLYVMLPPNHPHPPINDAVESSTLAQKLVSEDRRVE